MLLPCSYSFKNAIQSLSLKGWRVKIGKDYVANVNGAYWIGGTRVSLDSVIYTFLDGVSAESILENFPELTLEQVYGALAFYLAHRDKIDEYLHKGEAEFEALSRQLRTANPLLYQKLVTYKRQKQEKIA